MAETGIISSRELIVEFQIPWKEIKFIGEENSKEDIYK
jgi:hypothetical protein